MANHHNNSARADSQVTRRSFLTSAPAAVAVTAIPAAAIALPHEAAENPALLALGAELPRIEKDYQDALAAEKKVWRVWSPQWPLAPEPCCNFDWWGGGEGIERDLSGNGLVRSGHKRPAKLYTIAEMERTIEWTREAIAKNEKRKRKVSQKTLSYWHKEIERCELGIQLMPGYQAECARIKRDSQYDSFSRERRGNAEALYNFVRKVLLEPSFTIKGVRIKAEASAALGRMHSSDQAMALLRDSSSNQGMAELLGLAVLDVIGA